MSLPFRLGFSRVYAAFAGQGLQDDVVFIGTTLRQLYCYKPEWRRPSPETRDAVVTLMRRTAPRGGTAPPSQSS
jgi:hypothetical protein